MYHIWAVQCQIQLLSGKFTNNGDFPYASVTQQRGFVRDGINAMRTYVKDSTALIGELYMGLGFLEMSLDSFIRQQSQPL